MTQLNEIILRKLGLNKTQGKAMDSNQLRQEELFRESNRRA